MEQGGQASTWTCGCDQIQQLTDAIRRDLGGAVLEQEHFAYDRAGNRISVTTGTTTISTRNYKVNALNQGPGLLRMVRLLVVFDLTAVRILHSTRERLAVVPVGPVQNAGAFRTLDRSRHLLEQLPGSSRRLVSQKLDHFTESLVITALVHRPGLLSRH